MRLPLLLCVKILTFSLCTSACADEPPEPVSQATFHSTPPSQNADQRELDRIRKIVLNQGDNPRALANLVQLTRKIEPAIAAQLYVDLAEEHLRLGNYNQAANFLQQLINQHVQQPAASAGLTKLMQLYSSDEINHAQQATSASADKHKEFCQYALYLANSTLSKNPNLKKNFALNFQRAVAARGAGQAKLAQGMLTQLKHNARAEPWRTYARVEQWILEDRDNEAPLPLKTCRRTQQPPHLDGVLDEAMWQANELIQFAYDNKFFYLAMHYPKNANVAYKAENRPRIHDADLSARDRVQIRLDLDRDYGTYYELNVDHRGWTAESCWHDASWNPQWFVAAHDNSSTWSIEAAIPWQQLTGNAPQAGQAWAIAWERLLPNSPEPPGFLPIAKTPSMSERGFRMLLFE